MQAVRASSRVSASSRRVVAAAPVAPRQALRVVCKAQTESAVSKAAAFAAALPAFIAASPAFALVDERLNGDGTGLPLGVNDSALGWAIFLVFLGVWGVFFVSQRDLGDFEDDDAGLKID